MSYGTQTGSMLFIRPPTEREKTISDLCKRLGIDAELRGDSVNYLSDMEKILLFLLQREVERSK